MTSIQPEDDMLSLETKRKRAHVNEYEETSDKVNPILPLALQPIATINRDQLTSTLPWTGDLTREPAFNISTYNHPTYSAATNNSASYGTSSYDNPRLTPDISPAHPNKVLLTNVIGDSSVVLGPVSNVETKPLIDTARMTISYFRSKTPAERKPFPLMKLPAELRNRVMEMLFKTNTNTIYIRQRDAQFGFEENADGPGEPMNHIQYVSKQLRKEFHHHELKYNKLVAVGKEFLQLAKHGKPNLKSRVREVELVPLKEPFFQYMTPNPNVLPVLIDFCFQYPEANLKIRIEAFKFEGQMVSGRLDGKVSQKTCDVSLFLGLATIIQNSIRGVGIPIWSSGSNPCIVWGAGRLIPQLNAPNLKFFPCDEKFDREKFTRAWKTTKARNKNKILTRLGECEQAMHDEIDMWYKKGL